MEYNKHFFQYWQNIIFTLAWLIYCIVAFTPQSILFPFFSWRLYAEVKQTTTFYDIQYTDDQDNWHSVYRDTTQSRRGLQVLIRNTNWNDEFSAQDAIRYVYTKWGILISKDYQVVQQTIDLSHPALLDSKLFFPKIDSTWSILVSRHAK